MADPLCDVDLDALAPRPKRVQLNGKLYKLPGDMPMGLFLRIQAFDQRVSAGEDETVLLSDLQDELLALFQINHPELKKLPEIGVLTLLGSLGAIYGAAEPGKAPPARTPPQRKRTASKKSGTQTRARATSA